MKKIVLCFLTVALVLLLTAGNFVDHTPYVVDDAYLLNDSQLQDLETQAASYSAEIAMDVVIVTADDVGGIGAMAYADDYFDYNGYGQGADRDGILLLIDMDNREVWISTSGAAIRYFTDQRIESMLDSIFLYLPDGEYYQACLAFLDDVLYYFHQGIPSGQYTVPPPEDPVKSITGAEAMFAGLGAVASGGVFYAVVTYRYRVGSKLSKFNPLENTSYRLTDQQDIFVNQSVSQRRIVRSSSYGGGGRSSTHSSSSGRSHGGGGRRF